MPINFPCDYHQQTLLLFRHNNVFNMVLRLLIINYIDYYEDSISITCAPPPRTRISRILFENISFAIANTQMKQCCYATNIIICTYEYCTAMQYIYTSIRFWRCACFHQLIGIFNQTVLKLVQVRQSCVCVCLCAR